MNRRAASRGVPPGCPASEPEPRELVEGGDAFAHQLQAAVPQRRHAGADGDRLDVLGRAGRSGSPTAPRGRRSSPRRSRAGPGSPPCCRSGSPCPGRTSAWRPPRGRCRGGRGSGARAPRPAARQMRQIWRTSRWHSDRGERAGQELGGTPSSRKAVTTAGRALRGDRGHHQDAGRELGGQQGGRAVGHRGEHDAPRAARRSPSAASPPSAARGRRTPPRPGGPLDGPVHGRLERDHVPLPLHQEVHDRVGGGAGPVEDRARSRAPGRRSCAAPRSAARGPRCSRPRVVKSLMKVARLMSLMVAETPWAVGRVWATRS